MLSSSGSDMTEAFELYEPEASDEDSELQSKDGEGLSIEEQQQLAARAAGKTSDESLEEDSLIESEYLFKDRPTPTEVRNNQWWRMLVAGTLAGGGLLLCVGLAAIFNQSNRPSISQDKSKSENNLFSSSPNEEEEMRGKLALLNQEAQSSQEKERFIPKKSPSSSVKTNSSKPTSTTSNMSIPARRVVSSPSPSRVYPVTPRVSPSRFVESSKSSSPVSVSQDKNALETWAQLAEQGTSKTYLPDDAIESSVEEIAHSSITDESGIDDSKILTVRIGEQPTTHNVKLRKPSLKRNLDLEGSFIASRFQPNVLLTSDSSIATEEANKSIKEENKDLFAKPERMRHLSADNTEGLFRHPRRLPMPPAPSKRPYPVEVERLNPSTKEQKAALSQSSGMRSFDSFVQHNDISSIALKNYPKMPSDLPRQPKQKQIVSVAIGTTVKGVVEAPLFWSEGFERNSDRSSSRKATFSIRLSEPLRDSDGNLALDEGTFAIAQVERVLGEGYVEASVIAVVYRDRQGIERQQQIPPGQILVLAEEAQPLMAEVENDENTFSGQDLLLGALAAGDKGLELLNRPDNEFSFEEGYGGGYRSSRSVSNRNRNLGAALGEGFFETVGDRMSERITSRQSSQSVPSYVVKSGREITLFVNSFLEVAR